MYCILVTGIPASGKSTLARELGARLGLPVFSKDAIKELLFDTVGFESREEKVRLGEASLRILCYNAAQLMQRQQPFILENNFENTGAEEVLSLLARHRYQAVTVTLTGDYRRIYERFLAREQSPERHLGHVVNDCYPPKGPVSAAEPISFERFCEGIRYRGMDTFTAGGPQLIVDTTEFAAMDLDRLTQRLRAVCKALAEEGKAAAQPE